MLYCYASSLYFPLQLIEIFNNLQNFEIVRLSANQ